MDAVTFMKINLPVRLIEISRHVSGQANASWHVLSLRIRASCKSDWSEGWTACETLSSRQTAGLAPSEYNFTVQWDARGMKAEGVYTSHPAEMRRGGLWAGWQITGHSCCHGDCRDWRRWITHQRSSVNHQSPLTFPPQTPPPPPSPRTHIVTHTH